MLHRDCDDYRPVPRCTVFSVPAVVKRKPTVGSGFVTSPRKRTASAHRQSRKITPRERIRLLIADDHAVILEGLAATIGRQDDMTVVAKASNGREAVELWKMHRPDVSLLDLRMPILNAVGVIKEGLSGL